MDIFYKDIKLLKVFDKENVFFDFVSDLIFDILKGKLIAIKLKMRQEFVLTTDIIEWRKNEILVENKCVTFEEIKKNYESSIGEIINKKVFTASGDFVGIVCDYCFENIFFSLKFIKTHKNFLRIIRFQKNEIPFKNIIEIKQDRIIINDIMEKDCVKKGEIAVSY